MRLGLDYCGYRFRCGGAVVSWYEPADGVPLSGLESSQACAAGSGYAFTMNSAFDGWHAESHSDWMFLSTTYGSWVDAWGL